ncbi:unnamed protein product [Pleuronectes platessa]|uniref:Uncharacterized protein n=1 Tax=Pleuronectes platessa TaxID=8262 RepID=A0A9N7VKL3_PLEPL|nr:unnamed protein product [Pleuronectes platessa]
MSCPVPSTLPAASTGVCGSAFQSDGTIITHHSSERKSGSTQPAHCTVCRPVGTRWSMDAQVILNARGDSLRVWQDILSACDPHWVPFAQGSGSEMRRLAGGAERPEGVCRTKRRDV